MQLYHVYVFIDDVKEVGLHTISGNKSNTQSSDVRQKKNSDPSGHALGVFHLPFKSAVCFLLLTSPGKSFTQN